ncbi:hypothetical protein Pst134EA_032374 [Puccinia striiformis f. sp. tritici]|uniref:uncharacterized protein n=2 Tax=Puccinia striiformis f. sp. tritici TaxID=168172 RepID=UPI002007CA0D|nr:uncharacterized protein Pst134EA_032374 [Puccinia striiformis f. sp. tritici]KAH9441769.1 hypothetical protein Pst134EA_032374 [Puccinia striiformis f. sp. tritici]
MALEGAEIQMGDIDVMDKDMRIEASSSFQTPSTAVTIYTSPSGSNKRSWVWAHFIEIDNGTSVKCTVVKRGGEPCGRVLKKDKTGSTKSMHEHLMALHKLGDPQKRARTEASIDKYLAKNAKSIPHDPMHPANLICELCRNFYQLGWVTGTGGGISIRQKDHVFIAPSGVQKERMKPCDIFILDLFTREQLRRPSTPLKQSACTPLFFNAYEHRSAGACIHTHSQHAVMATLLWPGQEFRCSHLEMIKGMRFKGTEKSMSYLDTLIVPIIENTPHEEDLREDMEKAMLRYPDAPAVLVRRHGTYSWGKDWEQAKCQAECLDYLLEMAVKMKLAGLPTEVQTDRPAIEPSLAAQ